jgi:hypothetical protein
VKSDEKKSLVAAAAARALELEMPFFARTREFLENVALFDAWDCERNEHMKVTLGPRVCYGGLSCEEMPDPLKLKAEFHVNYDVKDLYACVLYIQETKKYKSYTVAVWEKVTNKNTQNTEWQFVSACSSDEAENRALNTG